MTKLELTLLAYPKAEFEGKQLVFKGRQSFALLLYLAMKKAPVSRTKLAEVLFNDSKEVNTNARFRRRLADLMKTLRDAGCEYILKRSGSYLSIESSMIKIDVDAFEKAVFLKDTLALKRYGVFLQGFHLDALEFNCWVTTYREQLEKMHFGLLLTACKDALAKDNARALKLSKQLVSNDPLHEEANLLLIEVLSKQAERHLALEQYTTFCDLLRSELDLEPLVSTQEKVAALLGSQKDDGPLVCLNTLPEAPRKVLELASAFRQDVSISLLHISSKMTDEVFTEACDTLEQRSFLNSTATGYQFTNSTLKTFVYKNVPPARKRLLHKCIALSFTKLNFSAYAEDILDHAELACLWQKAYDAARQAAINARSVAKRQEAVLFEARAINAAKNLKDFKAQLVCHLAREEDYYCLGHRSAQAQELVQLKSLAFRLGCHEDLLVREARYLNVKNPIKAELLLRQGLALKSNTNADLSLKLELAYTLLRQCNFDEAQKEGQKLFEQARKHNNQDAQLAALFCQARSLIDQGRFEEAHKVLDQAQSFAHLKPFQKARYLNLRASVCKRQKSQLPAFKTYAEQAYKLYKHLNYVRGQADSLNLLALAACYEENAPVAQSRLSKAEALYKSLEDVKNVIAMQANQGFLQQDLYHNHRSALEYFQVAHDMFVEAGLSGNSPLLKNNVAACFNKLGEAKSSKRFCNAALEGITKNSQLQGSVLNNRATSLRLLGDFHEGLNQQYKAKTMLSVQDNDYPELLASMVLNHLALGQKEKALEHVTCAERLLRHNGGTHNYLVFAVKAFTHYHLKDDAQAQQALDKAQTHIDQQLKHLTIGEKKAFKEHDATTQFIEAAQQHHWKKGETLLS